MSKVRVGLCGFSMAMARYPFAVVEVQSTFYDPPADSVMRKWPRSLEYTSQRPKARLLWEPRGNVDPFVTPPQPGHPVYWRLHGIGAARYSYTAADLRRLRRMLAAAAPPGPAYVLFNNLPRVGDAKRFIQQPARQRRR